jgi:Amt family ammonium transporter
MIRYFQGVTNSKAKNRAIIPGKISLTMHGIGGLIGVIATGVLATTAVNPAGAEGLLNGSTKLFMANLTGAAAVAIYSMVATFVIIKVVGLITPFRATAANEKAGLDASEHGESIQG